MEPTMMTFTGVRLNPLDPKPEDIRVEDIAHALANVNRFGGHAKNPISVAQHSVYVSYRCPGSPLQALLHDASEAYLGDVTKWLKMSPTMAGYREAEDRVQRLIYRKFGCPEEDSAEVKEADVFMVRYEFEQAYGLGAAIGHPRYPPVSDHDRIAMKNWDFWSWREARIRFLTRFDSLYKGENPYAPDLPQRQSSVSNVGSWDQVWRDTYKRLSQPERGSADGTGAGDGDLHPSQGEGTVQPGS